MTTTLTLTGGPTSFTYAGYTILPSGTAVPDEVAPRIMQQAVLSGVFISGAPGGATYVGTRRYISSSVGAPTTGSWLAGDQVEDANGVVWETTGGSPGTWTQPGGGNFARVVEHQLSALDPRVGAVGDGATVNDAAVISTRIKTLLSNGGECFFPPGLYLFSGKANFDNTNMIALTGPEMHVGRNPRITQNSAELRFTDSGTTPLVSARAAIGFTVKGLALRYSNSSFSGRFIDLTSAGDPVPTYAPKFQAAVLGGAGVANASYVVDLGNSVEASFTDTQIAVAVNGVMGFDGSNTFSTAASFFGGEFSSLSGHAIVNPHRSWTLYGTVLEQNASTGAPAGIVGSSAFPCDGLSLFGVGMWDATAAGIWLDLYGQGINLFGCYVELPATGTYCRLNGTVGGFKSIGNMVKGANTATYLATANTPAVRDFLAMDSFGNGLVDNQGSLSGVQNAIPRLRVKTITATYTCTYLDFGTTFLLDGTAGNVTFTLPDALLSGATGSGLNVKRIDASGNTVNISPAGGQRLDGGFGVNLTSQQGLSLVSDGNGAPGGWYAVGKV